MSGGGKKPMKIVIIDTQYVETDATSFKSVVQELTGKESHQIRRLNSRKYVSSDDEMKNEDLGRVQMSKSAGYCDNSVHLMKRALSFKEVDRWIKLKEMPSVEELYGLWDY